MTGDAPVTAATLDQSRLASTPHPQRADPMTEDAPVSSSEYWLRATTTHHVMHCRFFLTLTRSARAHSNVCFGRLTLAFCCRAFQQDATSERSEQGAVREGPVNSNARLGDLRCTKSLRCSVNEHNSFEERSAIGAV